MSLLIVSMNICSLIYIFLLLLNWITTIMLVLFMHRYPIGTLVPLDIEIKATLRRNRAERRRKLLQDRTIASILEEETHFSDSSSPYSPSSRESTNQLSKTATMANEHDQRTTLEDYSSSLVPQFFTSSARPEVQAHNITYHIL